jgi:sugar-specific transcriptional regulator TrmB
MLYLRAGKYFPNLQKGLSYGVSHGCGRRFRDALRERALELQDEVQTLTCLGLTSNEARVYLSLLRLGISTAKAISKNSGVARPEIYQIMAKLEKLGLVERIISAPCKFRAISMQHAFSVLIERRIKVTSELQATTRKILKKFKNNNARTALKEDETQFILMPEKVVTRREKKSLENVQRSFDAVTSWENPHSVIFIDMEEIAEALQRGVEIRIIIDEPIKEKLVSDIIKPVKKYPAFKIRNILSPPAALISVYDKKEAWVCTCTTPELTECPTLRINNPCMLSILQDYFEILWMTAVEDKITN